MATVITSKVHSAVFAAGAVIVPGTHRYDLTDGQLVKLKQNSAIAHYLANEIMTVQGLVIDAETVGKIAETAGAKELVALLADVDAARAKAIEAAALVDESTNAAEAKKAQAAAKKAQAAFEAAEEALGARRAELDAKKNQTE